MTQRIDGTAFISGSFLSEASILIDGDTITYAGPESALPSELNADEHVRHDGLILPGLVDIHCHGGGGESFPNAETAEQAMVSVLEHRRFGTTSLVASCVTAAPEVLRARTRVLAGLCEDGELAGIHFEGPFVSVERCGAQDPTYIIDPDAALTRELIELGGGHVVTMTIAPEKPGITGDDGVNAALIEGGALPSFGHTDSEAAPVRAALEAAVASGAAQDLAERYHVLDYLTTMEQAYACADGVLCRSGAGTVAEITALGLPALYVPLPIGNGEQRLNAADVLASGGGRMVLDAELKPSDILDFAMLISDPERQAAMARAAASTGVQDAAARLAALIRQCASIHDTPTDEENAA